MSQRPFTCPECSTYVRQEWLDDCGACGASLKSSALGTSDSARTNGQSRVVSARSFTALLLVGMLSGGSAVAVFGTSAHVTKAAPSVSAVSTTTTLAVTTTTTATTLALAPVTNWVKFTDKTKRFSAEFSVKPTGVANQNVLDGVVADVYSTNNELNGETVLVIDRTKGRSAQEEIDALHFRDVPAGTVLISDNKGEATGFLYEDFVSHSVQLTSAVRTLVTERYVYVITKTVESSQDVIVPFARLTGSFTVLTKGK